MSSNRVGVEEANSKLKDVSGRIKGDVQETDTREKSSSSAQRSVGMVILATSVPMFLVALNNLVVTNALPVISSDFGASQQDLQWVINAYVLPFAGLLLTAAALGDRFGRKKAFLAGTVAFIIGSVICALAGSLEVLLAGRIVQGIGAAAVLPLSLTLLSAEVPIKLRSAAVGIWSAVNGLGIALGPLVGGAVTDGFDWKWVFWLNVPLGFIGLILAGIGLIESFGEDRRLDLVGMATVTGAVTVFVWGIVRAGQESWGAPSVVTFFVLSALLLSAFIFWESRAEAPLLPLRFYRIPAFVLSNLVSMAMYFGAFGSIFFLVQYLQGPLGYSALGAGVRTLPWTVMPMVVAPLAGVFTDRLGGGRLMAAGLGLQAVSLAWIAIIAEVDLPYSSVVLPMIIGGTGMGLVFTPTAAVVLASVKRQEAGKASGANNTVREIGGALGIAVLTTVFARFSAQIVISNPHDEAVSFVHGMQAAIVFGVVVLVIGAVLGALIPKKLTP